jgi:HK97 family phage major capsid protein
MERDEVLASLQALRDASETRELTEDEFRSVDELEARLANINRTEQFRSRVDAYTAPATAPVRQAVVEEEDAHQRAFESYVRTSEDIEYRAQSELVGSEGGYLVPDQFRNKVVEKMLAFGGFAPNADNITTSSGNPLEWVTVDDTANKGVITPENAPITGGADLVFGTATLGAYKYTTSGANDLPLKVSWELAQDSFINLEERIARFFAMRIARKQAEHWLTGDGTGEPLGLLTPKTAYDEIASNASGPSWAELVATTHAIDPAYRQNAKWLMNDSTLAMLQSQLDGADRPLYLNANDSMATAPGGTKLLGFDVIIDNAMPNVGDQSKFIAFGDFEQAYVIRRVKGFQLVVLKELYAGNGQLAYIGWERADGTVQDPNAYVVLAGQNV